MDQLTDFNAIAGLKFPSMTARHFFPSRLSVIRSTVQIGFNFKCQFNANFIHSNALVRIAYNYTIV